MLQSRICVALLICATAQLLRPLAASEATPPMTSDDVLSYATVTPQADYILRKAFIPMRDGVKLYTLILMRKGTSGAPILLTRTPYGADSSVHATSQHLSQMLAPWNIPFVDGNYIRVFQDIRGRHRSEGVFVANRPLSGPLNPTGVDESTDARDTIDWLSRNVAESNGRVAVIGGSYDGWLALMATIHPSAALRAVVAINPMVDLWRGDDWFHNGAFRQITLVAIPIIMSGRSGGGAIDSGRRDAYSLFLPGSAGDYIRRYMLDQFPYVRKLMEHPSYDTWWRGQALDRLLVARPLKVPLLLVGGQWDEQDLYGATAVYRALESRAAGADKLHLALGPWAHMGALGSTGDHLGPLRFGCDTARQFRRDYMKPFLDAHLLDGDRASLPSFLGYETGADRWEALRGIPKSAAVHIYLRSGFRLSHSPPTTARKSDAFVSDPAKPVPSVPRPFLISGSHQWRTSLVVDQRFAADRTDVLSYETEPLQATVHIVGWPRAELYASTTGTDADWVVKLIDVYPDEYAAQPDLAGYELGVSMDIFRGRYLHGYNRPRPLTPRKVERYSFELPMVDHVFERGHRIMVQIQSSWFPIYDRNPQVFVPSTFDVRPAAYRKATQRVFRDAQHPSAVVLPVVQAARHPMSDRRGDHPGSGF